MPVLVVVEGGGQGSPLKAEGMLDSGCGAFITSKTQKKQNKTKKVHLQLTQYCKLTILQ